MKKTVLFSFLVISSLIISGFGIHKFYMGIYQINYVSEKKMIQITTRVFIDDFNKVLQKKYNKKLYLATEKETAEELDLVKKYLSEKLTIKINGVSKPIEFLSKEIDDDILICYGRIKEIPKIKTIEMHNAVFTDYIMEQQNVVHLVYLDKKNSFLFTESSTTQMLKHE
jgi:hypothetical protein